MGEHEHGHELDSELDLPEDDNASTHEGQVANVIEGLFDGKIQNNTGEEGAPNHEDVEAQLSKMFHDGEAAFGFADTVRTIIGSKKNIHELKRLPLEELRVAAAEAGDYLATVKDRDPLRVIAQMIIEEFTFRGNEEQVEKAE